MNPAHDKSQIIKSACRSENILGTKIAGVFASASLTTFIKKIEENMIDYFHKHASRFHTLKAPEWEEKEVLCELHSIR